RGDFRPGCAQRPGAEVPSHQRQAVRQRPGAALRQRLPQRRGHPLPGQPANRSQGRRRAEHHSRGGRGLTMSGAEEYDEVEPAEDGEGEGAEGAAVFPLIPADLKVNPLLLALLHAMVFIDGSTEAIIDPDAAEEAMQYIVTYLARLEGPALARLQEDLDCLLAYAKQQGWPKQQLTFLKAFLPDYGLEG